MWIKTFSVFLLLAFAAMQTPGSYSGRLADASSLINDKSHSQHSSELVYALGQEVPADPTEDAPGLTSQTDLSLKLLPVCNTLWHAHYSLSSPRYELQPRSSQGPPHTPQLA